MLKKKILIVDDELVGRQLLQALLMVEGYQPILAKNATEALQITTNEHPDLILLDIMMPEINGFEFLKKIKAIDKLKHIPVILISALDDRDSKAKGLNAGARDYISKPYDSSNVILKIKKTLYQL